MPDGMFGNLVLDLGLVILAPVGLGDLLVRRVFELSRIVRLWVP